MSEGRCGDRGQGGGGKAGKGGWALGKVNEGEEPSSTKGLRRRKREGGGQGGGGGALRG